MIFEWRVDGSNCFLVVISPNFRRHPNFRRTLGALTQAHFRYTTETSNYFPSVKHSRPVARVLRLRIRRNDRKR
jgi:23S rRNA A2030 N6-methylase RlmJ